MPSAKMNTGTIKQRRPMSGTSAWSVCKMWAVFSETEMYREKEDVEIAMEAEDADTKDRLAHGAVGPASCMGVR